MVGGNNPIDTVTRKALERFLARVQEAQTPPGSVLGAVLFGSRARGVERCDSDADVAVLLAGDPASRVDVALRFADIAFDVMLDTGILIEAIPLWQDEWAHPERFPNPALIEHIRREGVYL